jgi:hypothetical protein
MYVTLYVPSLQKVHALMKGAAVDWHLHVVYRSSSSGSSSSSRMEHVTLQQCVGGISSPAEAAAVLPLW